MKVDIEKSIFEDITKKLVQVYSPLSIYLFGSYAWGKPNKASDIDFYIILEHSNLDSAERIRLGLRELLDQKFAIDLFVVTKQEIKSLKDHPSTLAHKVLSKGIKLYEAA